jgi:outer membrane protein assembly factor BamB
LLRRPGRRGLLIAAVVLVLLAAGAGVAVYLVTRTPTKGGLVTPTDVTVVTTDTSPAERATRPPPKPPLVAVDKPCWPAFGGDPMRSLARPEIDLGRPGKSVWARGLGDLMEFPPVYCAGRLFVNLEHGKTLALDARTGKTIWSRTTHERKASSPAIAGGNVVVTSFDGTITALRQLDGRIVWQLRTGGPVESSPVAVGGTVYVGATDGRLLALDAATGRVRWAYDLHGRINSSPSVVGRLVCITTYSGAIGCLHRGDGTRAWVQYFKRDAFRWESFYSSASSDGRRLFAVARTGRLVALDVRNGDTLWSYRTGALTYATPAVAAGRVFAVDLDGDVVALRAGDGKRLWSTHVSGRILAPALVVGRLVFFSTLSGRTFAARTDDGRIVWQLAAGKYSPGIATRSRYYLSLNGLLAAFTGSRSGRP